MLGEGNFIKITCISEQEEGGKLTEFVQTETAKISGPWTVVLGAATAGVQRP